MMQRHVTYLGLILVSVALLVFCQPGISYGESDNFIGVEQLLQLYDSIRAGDGTAEQLFSFQQQWYSQNDTPTPTPTQAPPTETPTQTQQPTATETPTETPGSPTSTPTQVIPDMFNLPDFFPLAANSSWYYVGMPEEGGSEEDNFTWEQKGTKTLGDKTVTIIQTTTDETTDSRNGDQDFWYVEQGTLYYKGYRNGTLKVIGSGFTQITIPSQDIVFNPGLAVGGMQRIGDTVTSEGTAQVSITLMGFPDNVTATVKTTVAYDRFDPTLNTPLGTFTNVLHMTLSIDATVYGQELNLRDNEFWLKQGVGMVKQDQDPDPSDAQVQGIQSGQVGGVTIVAD